MKVYRILMVAIMLAILTVGAVSAADNATQDTVSASDSDGDIAGNYLNEDDFYMNADENETLSEVGQDQLQATDSGSAEHGNATSYDGKYYLFRGDCWTIVNNFEASAAITSESYDDLTVTGTFRTTNDLIGIYWYSKDILEHPYISYGERSDYSDVVLEFDYNMTGCKNLSDVTLTIATNNGETYYFSLSRFIQNGHVTLNFSNLTLLPGNVYHDRDDNAITVVDETKINVDNLKSIMIPLVSNKYNGVNFTIMNNTDFTFKITNITVTNGEICDEHPQLEPHQYRICEGYDDSYNLNPFRLAKEMRKLGYSTWVDLYIGASYYYEKSGNVGDVITEMGFNHNRTEMMVLNKSVPLNKAFMAWLDCYSRELKNNGVENLIISVSMENLQAPKTWRQSHNPYIDDFAMTSWEPQTFLFSPCNDEVISYMQNVSEACLDIVVSNGMRPILQMGETWWWWMNDKPYFYDNETQAKYKMEHNGTTIEKYNTVWAKIYDEEVISWLNQQLVHYSDSLHDVVKSSKYTDGLYMVLFYLPSVVDEDTIPKMIREVNLFLDINSSKKIDILQIEDYDWVIWNNTQHSRAYTIGQELGFSEDRLHYFGGFVQYSANATKLWPLIEKAMDDAIENNFSEVYVWAGSQVRRDAKIIGYDEYAILKNIKLTGQAGIVSPIITAPEFASNEENFTIKMLTDEWINGAFKVYEYKDGAKGNLIASNNIVNGSSSVILSNTNIGLNKYYLEFNYTDGGYHLIYEVYIIENSQNITANVSAEVESGSDANITFTAPVSSSAYVNISVDENTPVSYLVENGKFSTAIANLSDGDHTVLVTYNNGQYVDKKLIGEVYYKTFTVKVGTRTDIETSDVNKTYNSSDVLQLTLKDSNGTALEGKNVSIVLNGTEHTVKTDKKGQANLTIDLLPGNYTAEIAYAGDNVYLSAHASANVTVNKIVTELTSNDINVTYGDEAILFITLNDNNGTALIGKDIIISLDGENHTVTTDKNGKANLTVDSLPGNYTAEISYAGDLVYVPSTYISNIQIDKIITNLTTSDVSFIYDEPVDLIVALFDERGNALTGKEVLITLDGVNHTVTINNDGKANLTLDVLPGNYTAEIFYLGDNVYVESSAVANIAIDKVTTNLTTEDVSYIYDEPTDLIITLKDRKGNALNSTDVLISLDGKNHTVTTDDEGKATLTIDSLPGNYTAEISYAGDKVYVESTAISNIVIDKVVTNLTTADVSYIYDEPTDLIITLKDRKGNPLKSTDILISLDGKNHTVTTDNDGKATLTIDSLPGNYTAEISYAGDKVYVESAAVSNIAIGKVTTNLTTEDVSYIYDEPTDLIITLTDRKGNALKSTKVSITLDGKNHTVTTDDYGKATLTIDSLPGNYTAEISYAGDEVYVESSAISNIAIAKVTTDLFTSDVSYIYDDPVDLIVILNDRNGNPLKSTNVLVSLDGKNHTLTTDNEGKATLPIDSLPGNYVAEITYAGDDVYVESSAVSNVSIEKVATSLTTSDVSFIYDEPTDLIITLTDRKGNALKSTKVSITLDGKNHTLTTDSEGKVAFPIDSLPGIYLAEISYAGDDVYVESTAGSQITIEKIETIMTANNIGVIYGDEANLIVTLKDRKGNAVSGKDISIALDGKDHMLTTNADGQVTLAVDSLPGDYVAEILYTGDDVYVSSSVSSDISIYKIVTSLSSTDISFIYDDPTNLVVSLKDRRGNPLADKDISVSIDGVRNMVTTASNGQAAFAVDVLPGSYVAEISFAGDNVYVSSNTSSNIKIDKVSTSLTANDVQFIYGDLTYLVATLKDRKGNEVAGKDILITLDGVNHTVTTDSNGQVKLAVDSLPGNYTARISFAGDKVFIASSASADVSIDKISTILSANDITAIYGNTKSLTVILKDERGKFLAGQNITILINNKVYKRTTDENGRAVLSINLPVKKYTAVIDLKGDAIYKPSTYTSKVVINKATPTLTALSKIFSAKSKTKKVTATLKNKNNAIKNALVKLTVNKKTYKVKTNSKGVATFKVKLTKRGKYNAVYKFAGNSNFKSATKKVKITLI